MTTSDRPPMTDILAFAAALRAILEQHGVTGARQSAIALEAGDLAIEYANEFYHAVRRAIDEKQRDEQRERAGALNETTHPAPSADRPPFEAVQRDCGGDEASGGMGRGSQETGDIGKIG